MGESALALERAGERSISAPPTATMSTSVVLRVGRNRPRARPGERERCRRRRRVVCRDRHHDHDHDHDWRLRLRLRRRRSRRDRAARARTRTRPGRAAKTTSPMGLSPESRPRPNASRAHRLPSPRSSPPPRRAHVPSVPDADLERDLDARNPNRCGAPASRPLPPISRPRPLASPNPRRSSRASSLRPNRAPEPAACSPRTAVRVSPRARCRAPSFASRSSRSSIIPPCHGFHRSISRLAARESDDRRGTTDARRSSSRSRRTRAKARVTVDGLGASRRSISSRASPTSSRSAVPLPRRKRPRARASTLAFAIVVASRASLAVFDRTGRPHPCATPSSRARRPPISFARAFARDRSRATSSVSPSSASSPSRLPASSRCAARRSRSEPGHRPRARSSGAVARGAAATAEGR